MSYIGRTPPNAALTASDLADGIVGTAKIAADAVTDAKIADDIVGTEHLTANEVDTAALAADAVTGAELADNAVNSEHYTDGSIDTIHIGDNQITLAKMAGGTDGNIISFDASGDPVAIATGNDGQVLTSTGAGSPPAFEALPSGGLYVKTATATISSTVSQVVMTNCFSSTYSKYKIIINGIRLSNANEHIYYIPMNGSNQSSNEHAFAMRQYVHNNTKVDVTNDNDGNISLFRQSGSGAGKDVYGILNVFNPLAGGSKHSYSYHFFGFKEGDGAGFSVGGGRSATDQTYPSFRIEPSGNNMTAGTITVYGLTNPA